jgi:NDP-sugar pyrophosphorylase family protein
MKAVILAGGLGKRLKPFTEVIPKPLLPFGKKAILELQIEALKRNGFDEIFLATNYKSEYIENFIGNGNRYGVKVKISKEEKPLGTVGPLTLLKNEFREPFLVMNGDILTLMNFNDLYQFAVSQSSMLTVSIKEFVTPFQFGNIYFSGNYVTKIEEKPNITTNILAGIYVFKPDIYSMIPEDEYYGMDTLISNMLNNKLPITKYMINDYWLDIGQVDDYEKAQEIYKNHFLLNM